MTTISPNDPFTLAEKQAELKALRVAIGKFEAARDQIAGEHREQFAEILAELKQKYANTGRSIGLIFETT